MMDFRDDALALRATDFLSGGWCLDFEALVERLLDRIERSRA